MLYFLRNKNFWLIAACLGVLLSGPMGLLSNLVPFALEKGIDATKGAYLLSIFSAANFAGKLSSGAIADRIDYRIMLAALMILLSAGMFGYLQSDTYLLLAFVSALVGIAQGAIVPLWSIILSRVYGPDNMGRSMGLMSLVIMPFTLVAPLLFGWSYDFSGSYDTALIGYMIVLVCMLAATGMISQEQQKPVTVPA